jgi:hypothetical protein
MYNNLTVESGNPLFVRQYPDSFNVRSEPFKYCGLPRPASLCANTLALSLIAFSDEQFKRMVESAWIANSFVRAMQDWSKSMRNADPERLGFRSRFF